MEGAWRPRPGSLPTTAGTGWGCCDGQVPPLTTCLPHALPCRLDIDFSIRMGVDFIAVSFVKTADVVKNLKSYVASRADKEIEIVAKVMPGDYFW